MNVLAQVIGVLELENRKVSQRRFGNGSGVQDLGGRKSPLIRGIAEDLMFSDIRLFLCLLWIVRCYRIVLYFSCLILLGSV